MKIFIVGGTGVVGKNLIPLILESGHEVVALTRSAEKAIELEKQGVKIKIADPLDSNQLISVIEEAKPEIIIHQLTALKQAVNFKKLDEEFVMTNRFRTEVTDTILTGARLVGAKRVIVQSFCGWPYAPTGGPIKTEEDPLDINPPASFRKTLASIKYLEDAVRKTNDIQVLALRYGLFYGPGTRIAKSSFIVEQIRQRKMPIVGNGRGIWSFIHIKDVAQATLFAISKGEPGIYNVVDNEPAPVSTWLPFLSEIVGAKSPKNIPAWIAKFAIGEGGVFMMTKIRGGSNEKIKREFGWQPIFPSWRQGFMEEFGQ